MRHFILITTAMIALMMGVGCTKSNSGSDSNGTPGASPYVNTYVPTITDFGGTTSGTTSGTFTSMFSAGDTVVFTPKSLDTMAQYTTTAGNMIALNNPTNIQINIDLSLVESGRYGGDISIGYEDNGIQRIGVFRAGTGRNVSYKGMYDNDSLEAAFNFWYTASSKTVFSGMFEDVYGSIVLTLEPETTTSGNDAEPFSLSYKGKVYFKNFSTVKTNSYRSCWYIYIGPWDCRSSNIMQKTSLTPNSGFTLLGSFTGLTVKKAFNME